MKIKQLIKRKLNKMGIIFRSDLNNSLSEMREQITSEIELINEKQVFGFNEQLKTIKSVENGLYSQINNNFKATENLSEYYKTLEYKVFQLNDALNKVLYENELKMFEMNNKKIKSKNPLISVVIPVYKGANFVGQAIDSVLNQSYKNYEIIVVNDGSNDKDETEKAVLKYGNKVRYFSKENGGVSTALNLGIKKMKGEYFAWLSHDDIFYPNYLQDHVNYLNHTNRKDVIAYTNFNIIDENGELVLDKTVVAGLHISDYKMTKTSHLSCLLQGEINGGSALIPKEAFDKVGLFNEKERITQEKDMWARMLKYYTFINIPYTDTAIRVHSNQVTSTAKNVTEETKRKLLEILDNISDEEKIKESGSLIGFYEYLKKHYTKNGFLEMADEMTKKIEQIRSEKNEDK